jgi:gas vesicle protein
VPAAPIVWRSQRTKGGAVKKIAGILSIATLALVLLGCPEKKKGTFEEAGAKLDKATEDLGDELENATEDLGDKVESAAEKVGNKMENAAEKARDAVKDAADEVEDKIDD